MAQEPINPPAQDEPPQTPDPSVDPDAAPPAEPPKPAAPAAATVEDLNRLHETIGSLRQQLEESQSSRGHEPPPVSAPLPPEITMSDVRAAWAEGEDRGFAKLEEYNQYQISKRTAALEQKIAQLENYGTTVLSQHAEAIVSPNLKYRNDPRFKSEIDRRLKNIPAAQRTTEVIQGIYNIVIGENIDTLLAENKEQAIRAAREPVNPSIPTGVRGAPGGAKPEEDTVENLLGEGAAAVLRQRGQTPDEFSKRLGYKDWPAYAAVIKAQNTGGV